MPLPEGYQVSDAETQYELRLIRDAIASRPVPQPDGSGGCLPLLFLLLLAWFATCGYEVNGTRYQLDCGVAP